VEFDRTGADEGCAIGSVALDLDANDATFCAVCQDAFDAWLASIANESQDPMHLHGVRSRKH
jgi:hypothetical protein